MDQKTQMLLKNPNAVVNELPHGLKHAVERLSLGFDLGSPLDSQTMRKLSALGVQIENLLPRKFEVSMSGVKATVGAIEQSVDDDAELFAILFDDNNDQDGPLDDKHTEVIIKNDGFNFAIYARYDGWEKTRQRALELYKVFYEVIAEKSEISSIDFRVSNVFGLDGFTGQLTNLLNVECESLPRRVFSAEGLWHIDEGYFDSHADSDMADLLVNLSVSKGVEDERETLSIKTMHQFDFNDGVSESISLEGIFDKFDHMHSVNKALLASVLNSNISKELGLLDDAQVKS